MRKLLLRQKADGSCYAADEEAAATAKVDVKATAIAKVDEEATAKAKADEEAAARQMRKFLWGFSEL